MESGLLPAEAPLVTPVTSSEIDGRGWIMVIIAMLAIGWWSHRPAPAPAVPIRIPTEMSEPWMADALPGIGVKTRDVHWRHLKAGVIADLPERARNIARQVFIWPAVQADQISDSAIPHRP